MDLGTLMTLCGAGLSCFGTIYSRKQSQKQQTNAIAISVKSTLENIFLTKANEQQPDQSQQLIETEIVEDDEDEAE